MKKKFVLVLALVLLVAATVSAADIKFSGRVRQGCVFTFDGSSVSVASQRAKEGKFALKVADADGLWALSFADLKDSLDSNDKLPANATVELSKALAKSGVDMGDLSLAFSIGNNGADTGLRAYNDVTGNGYDKFKNNGTYSVSMTLGYGKLVSVKLAGDPVTVKNDATANAKSFVATALVTPMDGIQVAGGYAYNYKGGLGEVAAKNAVYGAGTVDIAKIAGLDGFNVKVSAVDHYAVDAKKNWLQANIALGIKEVDGWVEFRQFDHVNKLNVQANFNLVENMGLDVYYDAADFAALADNWDFGADVSYKLGGVSYSLNAQYTVAAGVKKFALTPAIDIVF